ncbi:hypothetical protein COCVIDRAFT_114711, partial [Bipolaris victoriae FI3]
PSSSPWRRCRACLLGPRQPLLPRLFPVNSAQKHTHSHQLLSLSLSLSAAAPPHLVADPYRLFSPHPPAQ